MAGLARLAEMARIDEPSGVVGHVRPPKAFSNEGTGRIKSSVADIAVGRAEDKEASLCWDFEFMASLWVFVPELIIRNKEFHAVSHKTAIMFVGEVARAFQVAEPEAYSVNAGIGKARSVGARYNIVG